MGNSNYYQNKEFMERYEEMERRFLAETPLFEPEEIAFPLSTKDMAIVDATGRRVKLAGVNWSGGHAERHCVGGLDYQHIDHICGLIKKEYKLNSVRLCYSLQMFYDNNVIKDKLLKANPQFIGKTSMQIFD